MVASGATSRGDRCVRKIQAADRQNEKQSQANVFLIFKNPGSLCSEKFLRPPHNTSQEADRFILLLQIPRWKNYRVEFVPYFLKRGEKPERAKSSSWVQL